MDRFEVRRAAVVAIAVAVVAGCSGGATDATAVGEPPRGDAGESTSGDVLADAAIATDAGAPSGSGASADGSLKIVSLTATVTKLAPQRSTTIVAIVTSTAGLENIAGGQLMDTAGATYAPFGAGANKGTYAASVDWNTIHAVRSVDGPPPGSVRTFVAKFFDNDGRVVTADVDVSLGCDREWVTPTSTTFGIVEGTCRDFSDRYSCDGSATCTLGQSCILGAGCQPGREECFRGTRATDLAQDFASCTEFCGWYGQTCHAIYLGCDDNRQTYGSVPCSTVFSADASEHKRCVCKAP